jgi:hypothetical protein
MTEYLLKTGKHTVTAITRPGSTSKLPDSVKVAHVDYDDHQSLVDALKGQDALIITLAVMAPLDTQSKLIKAAVDAEVAWILPNEWGPDSTHEGFIQDIAMAFVAKKRTREEIASLPKSSFIAVNTGFWYEWSLAIPVSYGFDFEKKTVTFFDDGETLTSMTSWPQVGRAVAALLSLPIEPEGGDETRSLSHFRNKNVYVSSFTISQKDIFESVLRVTRTKAEEWTTTKEPSNQRYQAGVKEMQGGDRTGFAKLLYSRVFYPDGFGNFEKTRGTINDLLGLPKENLDEATVAAIERSKELLSL